MLCRPWIKAFLDNWRRASELHFKKIRLKSYCCRIGSSWR
jgi:hypothetical protein